MTSISGTQIIAPVVPPDTASTHPSHIAEYGKGGYRTEATTAARDAIPAARRTNGMLVYVIANGKTYRLGADLTTWTDTASSGVSIDANLNLGVGPGTLQAITTGASNVAIGSTALNADTSGNYNTGIGDSALLKDTTGSNNVAIGASSLRNNLSGDMNIAIGPSALLTNTTGYRNIAIGDAALYDNTTGFYNLAIGDNALGNNTIGEYNVAIGSDSLGDCTDGLSNVAIGHSAARRNTTGDYNIAIGSAALTQNTVGNHAIAIGDSALHENTTGDSNTAIGTRAMEWNTVGGGNLAIGPSVLRLNVSGNFNSALGYEAMSKNTTGSYNLAIGVNTLQENTTADGSVAIGAGTLRYLASGDGRNTGIGTEALGAATSCSENVALGYHALHDITAGSRCIALGTYAGHKETGYAKLIVDAIERTTEALGRSSAILYGVMDPDPTQQTLLVNASLTVAQTLTVRGPYVYLADDTTIQQNDGFLAIRAGSSGLYLRSNGGSVDIGDAYNVPVRLGAGGGLTTVKNGLLVEAGPTTIAESLKLRVVAVAAAAGTTYLSSIQCVAVLTGTGIETFVLPAISTGRYIVIKNRSTGNLTVDRDGTSTIDGGTSVTVLPGGAIQLVGSGTDWLLVGKY